MARLHHKFILSLVLLFLLATVQETQGGTIEGAFDTVKSGVVFGSQLARDLTEDIKTWGEKAKQSIKQIGEDVNTWGDAKIQCVKTAHENGNNAADFAACASTSSSECCEKIKIILGYEAALHHNITSGIYVANKYKLAVNNNKTNYQKELGNAGIYYNTKRERRQLQERWVVIVQGYPRLRSDKPDPSVDCPDKVAGWQFRKPKAGWVLNNGIKVTCLVGTENSTTPLISETATKPNNNTLKISSEKNHSNVIIGASVGGGLLSILVIVICAVCLYKRRRNADAERDDRVDENPVYMYDYADLDRNNEVYDTNAYYGAADVDTEGSTVATDLNPDYE